MKFFEDTYTSPKTQHAHMEPHAATAYWEPSGKLVVYASTQTPSKVREQLADLFGLPQSQVRVVVQYLGGGYGAKTHARLEPLVALVARKARRPAQWVLTREEVFLTAHNLAATVKVRTGVKRDDQHDPSELPREQREAFRSGRRDHVSHRGRGQ